MEVVDVWTGRRASALRTALRLTNETFAHQLGTAVRTVAKWNAQADLVPMPELQRALDTALVRADAAAMARFALLVGQTGEPGRLDGSAQAIGEDPSIAQLVAWIDERAMGNGEGERRIRENLSRIDPSQLRLRARQRGKIGQRELARAVVDLYEGEACTHRCYKAKCDEEPIETSLLSTSDWLDLRLPMNGHHNRLRLDAAFTPKTQGLDEVGLGAAARRVAEIVATESRVFEASLYGLREVDVSPNGILGTVALTDFVSYALTTDLLEFELVDALLDGQRITMDALPLRERYLASSETALDFSSRSCVGGPLALFAAARPASRAGRPADYVLLVQERSARVLNSARRLAVIPKAFHQPLVDFSDDALLSATLERELEEELLGRTELELAGGDQRHADPMHPSLQSAPMRWLTEPDNVDAWRMECTGFGINLLTGNYEFASLIVIDDERWWAQFGGCVQTNWEAGGIRQYSTLDREGLAALVQNVSWSNEGLFAFVQGLRRLAEIGGTRVDLPTIDMEMS